MFSAARVARPHEDVAQQLREAILNGTYAPGDRLPVERDLSELFQVSRSAIRQALLILDQQGLVRVRPGIGGGPFVARESFPAAVTAFENLVTADGASITEFARSKMVLEPAIGSYAAQTISPAFLERLESNLDLTRQGLDRGEDIRPLAIEFHSIIIRSTGNRILVMVLEILTRAMDRLPTQPATDPADQRSLLTDHERITEALRRHSPDEVHECMTTHLASIWRHELSDLTAHDH